MHTISMAREIMGESSRRTASQSLGETKKFRPFSKMDKRSGEMFFSVTPERSRVSKTSVEESVIVGTPKAITGTPRVVLERGDLLLPTPEPGSIPVLQS